jgi:hypothetical protein
VPLISVLSIGHNDVPSIANKRDLIQQQTVAQALGTSVVSVSFTILHMTMHSCRKIASGTLPARERWSGICRSDSIVTLLQFRDESETLSSTDQLGHHTACSGIDVLVLTSHSKLIQVQAAYPE